MGRPSKPYDALGEIYPVRPAERALMHRRVGGLLQDSEHHRPLIDLLANAYAMGMADAVDVMAHRNPDGEHHE